MEKDLNLIDFNQKIREKKEEQRRLEKTKALKIKALRDLIESGAYAPTSEEVAESFMEKEGFLNSSDPQNKPSESEE